MSARSVWKFPLEMTDVQTVIMPFGSRALAVQMQRKVPCLWALVDPSMPPERREVVIVGTGHVFEGLFMDDYIGTFQLASGALVFHVFMPSPDGTASDGTDQRAATVSDREPLDAGDRNPSVVEQGAGQ